MLILVEGKGGKAYYYDPNEKLLGRVPTKSNLKMVGSDNSLFYGIATNKETSSMILKIFNAAKIEDISNNFFTMSFIDNSFYKVETNINNDKQVQIKIRRLDGTINGVIKELYEKYKVCELTNISADKLVLFLDFSVNEIFFEKIEDANLCVKNHVFIRSKHKKIYEADYEQARQEAIKLGIKPNSPELPSFIEELIKARNPTVQKHYRDDLIKEFNGKCAICGINKVDLLIASHIVAYKDCADVNERIDPNNGLLLCPDHDKLFDKGLIGFDFNTGKIILPSTKILDPRLYGALSINADLKIDDVYLNSSRRNYLKRHKMGK